MNRRRAMLAVGACLWSTAAAAHDGLRATTSAPAGRADAPQVSQQRIDSLPAVPLTDMDGQARVLARELDSAEPLLLNFVFTTCSSSCSVQTAMLAQVQRELAARGRQVKFASISIDADNDTPAQLREFARRFDVRTGWRFYTGSAADLLRVQRLFGVYRGSKAAHPPVLLIRRDARSPWVRVEGFPTPADVQRLIDPPAGRLAG